MNITIIGGGNVGTQFAVHCATKGHDVTIFTSKPQLFSEKIEIVNENKETILSGKIQCITDNPIKAFSNTELIFITVPSFCIEDISKIMLPIIKKNIKVCIVPGTGGGECNFISEIKNKKIVVFGLQRVPSVARLTQQDKQVCAVGYRKELYVGALPHKYSVECSNIIENIFDIKCNPLPNYLNVTMTPSNPILHTTRLKTLFKDYKEGKIYSEIPLFYEDWNNETSDLLLKCDEEVQNICRELKSFNLKYVKSLKQHYAVNNSQELTDKIRSIKGFKGLQTPMIKVENGFIPNFNSRYFTADFSYGLNIFVQIAKFVNIETPNMIETLKWYYSIKKDNIIKEFNFSDYDITNKLKFEKFYLMN